MNPKHPDQPMFMDGEGVVRFHPNKIVRWLVDADQTVLDGISHETYSADDLAQFHQLIGYSVSGYGDLHLVSDEKLAELDAAAECVRLGGSNEHR